MYKKGGGGYITYINGIEIKIFKQYSYNDWVAVSDDDEIDIKRQTLNEIKYYLNNKNNTKC